VSVRIHSRGKQFDLGGGSQFDSIENLIEHYKEHPFEIANGRLVHLLQVHAR